MVDQVFHYLSQMQDYYICYREDVQDLLSFVCTSNAFFGDNILDQKSLQGYIMKLLNGVIAWRANHQDTVTTLSTKTELLVIS